MKIFYTSKFLYNKLLQRKWRNVKLMFLSTIIYFLGINGIWAKVNTLPNVGFSKTSQADSVNGRIVDDAKNPMPGVSVQIKGSSGGTLTDNSGRFKISASLGQTLIFKFLGYESREVIIQNFSTLNITLKEDLKSLDEIVVVGYGTQKKVNVIGSIGQLDGKDLESRQVPRLSNALTGQIAGVTVINRNGKPGSGDGQVRVRGVGSFGADPGALIIVDGVPLTGTSAGDLNPIASEGQGAQGYGGAPSGDLNSINPNDIESISILKDAASAAIYGSRAANGVILITTKRGKSGKARVDYNGYVGKQSPTATPQMANSVDYAKAMNRAAPGTFTDQQISDYATNGPNNDWLDQVLSGSGYTQQHNISASGGLNENNYFLSLGYLDQAGVTQKTEYKRYNGRMNLSANVLKNVNVSVQIAGIVSDRTEPNVTKARDRNAVPSGTESLLFGALQMAPNVPAFTPTGEFAAGNRNQGTPTSWLASNSFKSTPATDLTSNLNLNWKPLKGLTITGIGSYFFTEAKLRGFQASQKLSPSIPASLNSTLFDGTNTRKYKSFQALIDYQFSINKNHNISFLGGYSFESNTASSLLGIRQNVPNNFLVLDMGSVANMAVGGNISEWAIQSQFVRGKYDFKQKYLFETTLRVDASSRFPANNRYAVFPSLAAGWRIDQEAFFEKALSVVSTLKLKASWGKLGNQNIGDYPYQQVYSSGFNYPFGDVINTGVGLASYKDPNLHWETSRTYDIGIETGFFKNSLTFTATYFNKYTYDILYSPSSSISRVVGATISEINTGSLQNNGIELEAGYRNQKGQFNYAVNGNFTYIKNFVKSLGIGSVTQPNGFVGAGGGPFDDNLFVGYPLQMYYGYQADGVFMPGDNFSDWPNQRLASAIGNYVPQAGDIRYKDINGPNGVPDGQVDPIYDKTYLGSRIPKYTYGFNANLGFKGFDMSVFLQGVAGVQGILNRNQGWAFYNTGSIQNWQIEQSYNTANPTRYPAYPRLEAVVGGPLGNYQTSSFWILDGSYLRVKNAQLGYTIPNTVSKKMGIQKMRVYLSGENIFTSSQYPEGWDPEMNTVGNGLFYPILKTYSIGLNVNL